MHELRLPADVGGSDAEILRWLAEDGAQVDVDQPLVEVEAEKATIVLAAAAPGHLLHRAAPGTVVTAASVLATIHPTSPELDDARAEMASASPPQPLTAPAGTRFSNAAREEIQRRGLDPAQFTGRGLVTQKDLVGMGTGAVPVRRQRLPRSKILEIERLLPAAPIPTSSLTVSLDAAGLGPSRLLLPRILCAVAGVLTGFPDLNAAYVDGALDCYQEVNIGVAIDLGQGLRVPVIRNADTLSTSAMLARLLEFLDRYQRRQLVPADMTGGTVTVSDLSADGVMQFQPLLNAGQVLAVGVGGDPEAPGHPRTITAVFDHRASSGRPVAMFLREVRQRLLSPPTR